MLTLLLTLCTFLPTWATTIDMSRCDAVKQPTVQGLHYDHHKFAEDNNGRWTYERVPNVESYKDVVFQDFYTVAVENHRDTFYISISYKLKNGTSLTRGVEQATDVGKGLSIIKSKKESPVQYRLETQVLAYKPSKYMVYSVCGDNGNDKKNIWMFTLAHSKLAEKDEKEVDALYKKYGAPYKKLKMPTSC